MTVVLPDLRTTSTVPLGDTAWRLWPVGVLRSAGFPASLAMIGSDPELLDAALLATSADDPVFQSAYEQAARRHLLTLQKVAKLPILREAIAWQSPALLTTCLDALGRATRRNSDTNAKSRTLTSYLQRYTLKNDSISFFGPIAWFGIDPTRPTFEAAPGNDVIRRRSTHFETWAIDAVADTFATQIPDRGLLPVWRSLGSVLDGDVLRRPNGTTVRLSEPEREVWVAADGTRSGAEAGDSSAVMRLEALGVLRVGFSVGVGTWPERDLRAQIQALKPMAVRDRFNAILDELCRLKEAVGDARDSATLQKTNTALEAAFTEVTGRAASRRAGQTYAGRTLVYQEATRDIVVHLGAQVLDALARPLELLLQVADWLVVEIAERYRTFIAEWVERECARTGRDSLPFSYVIARLTPELTETVNGLPSIVLDVIAELQDRWSRVLPVDPAESGCTARSSDLVEACSREFPVRKLPAGFGTCHSPDFIIDAPSVQAVSDGAFRIVLGELHVGINSLEARAFVEQHPSPQTLLALAERTAAGVRTVSIPPKSSPFVTSRAAPPTALTSPRFRYLAWYDQEAPLRPVGKHLPGGELIIRAADGLPIVESVIDGVTYDVIDLLSDALTAITVNAFQPLPPLPHSPRIAIDNVVVARERWTVNVANVAWATLKNEAERFWAVQQWRDAHDLPIRIFVKSPLETKPFAVDLANLSSVASFAKALRAVTRAGGSKVTLTEHLPEFGEYWLTDGAGEGYTSEMRIVALHSRLDGEE